MKKNDFSNRLYKVIVQETEELERKGMYRGNGHHLAQRLCTSIEKEFKDEIENGTFTN